MHLWVEHDCYFPRKLLVLLLSSALGWRCQAWYGKCNVGSRGVATRTYYRAYRLARERGAVGDEWCGLRRRFCALRTVLVAVTTQPWSVYAACVGYRWYANCGFDIYFQHRAKWANRGVLNENQDEYYWASSYGSENRIKWNRIKKKTNVYLRVLCVYSTYIHPNHHNIFRNTLYAHKLEKRECFFVICKTHLASSTWNNVV